MREIAGRFKPSRTTFAALIGLLWAVSFGAIRDFVWADLREGLIDLRGLSRLTRALIWMGFGLFLVMVVVLLENNLLREAFSLIALPDAYIFAPGRGNMLPLVLVPLSMFFVTMAWAFVLTGALHSHLAIRLGVLMFYLLSAIRQVEIMAASLSIGFLDFWTVAQFVIVAGSILLMLLIFLVRAFGRPRPVIEFLLIFLAAGIATLVSHAYNVDAYHTTGVPLGLAYLQLSIMEMGSVVLPFLLFLGVDIADFAQQSSGWVTDIVVQRLPRRLPAICLFLFGGWRVYSLVGEEVVRMQSTTPGAEALAYAGVLGKLLCILLTWVLVSRVFHKGSMEAMDSDRISENAQTYGMPLVLAFIAPSLVSFLATEIGAAFPIPFVVMPMLMIGNFLNQSMTTWGLIVNAGALLLAFWLARRGQVILPLYLGLFGIHHIYTALTNPGALLQVLTWNGPLPEDFLWVVVILLAAVLLLARRRLTPAHAGQLFYLLFITFLLRQTNFISSLFSPIFGFAGVGFIAFGVLWDSLTSGSWANTDTPGLPRTSRIFLYLGYAILTITIVNWAVSTHNLASVSQLTGSVSLTGLDRFGRPMVYSIFLVVLAQVFGKLPEKGLEPAAQAEVERETAGGDAA
jgi:hypothetical protein